MISLLIFLGLCFFQSVNCKNEATVRFDFNTPPRFPIRLGNNMEKAEVLLDLIRPHTFVFGSECRKNETCTESSHKYIYDADKTGGKLTDKFFSDELYSHYNNFNGKVAEENIKILDLLEIGADIGVVTKGSKKGFFKFDGVLGLAKGIPGEKTSIIERVFDRLPDRKITIQQGHFYIAKKNQKHYWPSAQSTVTFGKYEGKLCENFTYYDVSSSFQWLLTADITVNGKTYKDQTITFLPGRQSQYPDFIYEEFFNDSSAPNEDNFPDVIITLDKRNYTITKKDYSWYSTYKDGTYQAFVERVPSGGYQSYKWGFGLDFMQHWCVQLKADGGFKKLQIGLGQNNGAFGLGTQFSIILFFVVYILNQF